MKKEVYQSNASTSELAYRPKVIHAVKTMPRWKWKLLGLGLLIGILGVLGQGAIMINNGTLVPTSQASHAASPPSSASPGSPGYSAPVNSPAHSSPAYGSPNAANQPVSTTPAPSTGQLLTPFMTRVGFSLFVGVIVGLLSRTFLRIAASISVLAVGGAMALSYFHVMNVDLTLVKTDTAQATNWLADQGFRVKDMLFHALPSSTSASIGFLLGFKKR